MVDVKPWASQVRKNCHMAIPETASQRIGGANLLVDFANSSLCITVRMQKLINESMQNVSRSGEKGGPACGWWKVESTMLG